MPVSLFVYGTLQVPEVMQAVTGSVFKYDKAILQGYRRYKIKHRTFPGIIKDNTCFVNGIVYRNVDDHSLVLLDRFEDICYERTEERINVDNEIENAFVYVIIDKCKSFLSDEEWCLKEFEKKYLVDYLERI